MFNIKFNFQAHTAKISKIILNTTHEKLYSIGDGLYIKYKNNNFSNLIILIFKQYIKIINKRFKTKNLER